MGAFSDDNAQTPNPGPNGTIDVLPGDVNQSGTLSSNDGFAALRLQSQGIGSANYLAFADIDGSGSISSNDGFFVLARQATQLPKGTPTAPPLPHPVQVDLAVAVIAGINDDDDDDKELVKDELDGIVDDFVDDLMKIR